MFESRITPVDPQVEIENLRKSCEEQRTLALSLRDTLGAFRADNASLLADFKVTDAACEYNKTKAKNYHTDLKIFEQAMRDTIDRQEWCHEEANLAIEAMNREFVSDFQIDVLTQEYETECIAEGNVRSRFTVTNMATSQEEADRMACEMDNDEIAEKCFDEAKIAGWDSLEVEVVD
jgi:hypothetical protein|tara:strand:- start:210 stop:740 length:531 start_codon:yes stop_codon:yes gene_type:complete